MTDTIPDHVGREAVRLLNETDGTPYSWPEDRLSRGLRTVAKLLMNPPAPMTDPDEEAAKRVLDSIGSCPSTSQIAAATKQMRKEREAWEAGRP